MFVNRVFLIQFDHNSLHAIYDEDKFIVYFSISENSKNKIK